MNYTIIDFISLLGAVCLFLYGMKVMSEGLQKVAGDRLRNILGIMTKTESPKHSYLSIVITGSDTKFERIHRYGRQLCQRST